MRDINVLNDYFVRYLFSSPDSNLILLDFINSSNKRKTYNIRSTKNIQYLY
nr:hypothetical protein [Brachyspira hampsonii]